jgi:uncharacterized repeat protein (TIGR03803 family)
MDGRWPAGLIQDSTGNLYGTTHAGGTNTDANDGWGGGTVFKLAPPAQPSGTWTETVLYSFCSAANCTDGIWPEAGLTQDAAGNLYGTTYEGGANTSVNGLTVGGGTVFKVDTTGNESVLYSFCSVGGGNCTDGIWPEAGLIQDAAGNLYGTTTEGGANDYGTVFKVDTTGNESVLYSFCSVGGGNCTDGWTPVAGLIQDAAGNLYGTTSDGWGGGGRVFRLTPPAQPSGTWTETVLYSFCSAANCADGSRPVAGLIQDAAGNLYGTTYEGGANTSVNGGTGGGTVFKVDTTGNETVLYSFCSVLKKRACTDGWEPVAGLIQDAAGNLYGTTNYGGKYNDGTVFKLAATKTKTSLTSSAKTSIAGAMVTLTATVTGSGTVPTGTVTFNDTFEGASTTLGSGTLSTVNGAQVATYSTSSLADGTHSITAVYSGEGNIAGSTSKALKQVVKQQRL